MLLSHMDVDRVVLWFVIVAKASLQSGRKVSSWELQEAKMSCECLGNDTYSEDVGGIAYKYHGQV